MPGNSRWLFGPQNHTGFPGRAQGRCIAHELDGITQPQLDMEQDCPGASLRQSGCAKSRVRRAGFWGFIGKDADRRLLRLLPLLRATQYGEVGNHIGSTILADDLRLDHFRHKPVMFRKISS